MSDDPTPTTDEMISRHYGVPVGFCPAKDHRFEAIVLTEYNWEGRPKGQSVDLFCVKCGQYRRNADAC